MRISLNVSNLVLCTVNYDNTVGAVGVVPNWLEKIYPVALVKINEETEELIRNPEGRLIRCKPGEPGELIGKIVTNSPLRDFKGYFYMRIKDTQYFTLCNILAMQPMRKPMKRKL